MIEQKVMYGLDNIYVAKLNGDRYYTPIRIKGAKSIEAQLDFKTEIKKAGKRNIRFTNFEGGSGILSVMGLTTDEYNLLFGHSVEKNKVTVTTTDTSPYLALMFNKERYDGSKLVYCLYKVIFKPVNIGARTIENGIATEENIDIEFDIEHNDGKIYYMDNCDESFFDSVII